MFLESFNDVMEGNDFFNFDFAFDFGNAGHFDFAFVVLGPLLQNFDEFLLISLDTCA